MRVQSSLHGTWASAFFPTSSTCRSRSTARPGSCGRCWRGHAVLSVSNNRCVSAFRVYACL